MTKRSTKPRALSSPNRLYTRHDAALVEYRRASAQKTHELAVQLRQLAKRVDKIGAVNSITAQSEQLFQAAGEIQYELTEIIRYAGSMRYRVETEGW